MTPVERSRSPTLEARKQADHCVLANAREHETQVPALATGNAGPAAALVGAAAQRRGQAVFTDLPTVAPRQLDFERYHEAIARPCEWKVTRSDHNALIATM
jgi:hypothetical protein